MTPEPWRTPTEAQRQHTYGPLHPMDDEFRSDVSEFFRLIPLLLCKAWPVWLFLGIWAVVYVMGGR